MTEPTATSTKFVFASRPARWWWAKLPRLARLWSPALGTTMADGAYLGTLRVAGAVMTPATAVVGYLAASHQWGYRTLPFESPGLLLVMVCIGAASAQLGAAFLLGFVVADFFVVRDTWSYRAIVQRVQDYWPGEAHVSYFVRERVPVLIMYGVFAVVLIKLPVLTRRLLRPFLPGDRAPLALSVAMTFFGTVLLTLVAVYLWARLAVVLFRPLYSWRRLEPLDRVWAPIQRDAALFARAAALVAGVRVVMQALTIYRPHMATRADLLELERLQPVSRRPLLNAMPRPIRAAIPAAFTTLLLSGFYEGPWDRVIVFGTLLVVGLVQLGVIPLPLGAWARLMQRVPVAIRLVATVAITYGFTSWYSVDRVRSNDSFRPLLIGLAASLLALVLLFPPRPTQGGAGDAG